MASASACASLSRHSSLDRKDASSGIVADKTFFLDAVDNDGDALRFQHNNGSHFDVIFLNGERALSV